eukprot:m.414286 g.414286  ORF g.414286 m.414286 type:complete len:103 (+) comp29306_c0_seq1:1570-1878(+)
MIFIGLKKKPGALSQLHWLHFEGGAKDPSVLLIEDCEANDIKGAVNTRVHEAPPEHLGHHLWVVAKAPCAPRSEYDVSLPVQGAHCQHRVYPVLHRLRNLLL